MLAEFVKRGGITEFNAPVHSENTAMPGLLDQFGGAQTALGDTNIDLTFPLSAISGPISKSSAAKRETLGGAARKIVKQTSAKLRRFVYDQPELLGIAAPDQPTSVWLDDGGAIV
ncbi:hypothetical protein ACSBLW_09315 [Thioclava sp. FR2]|uniref:hypothetical protein n=1 Tax=Thioclava sp. FR2 TaxID=3445780 RepID=UPI003EB8D19B